MRLYIDLETAPATDPALLEEIAAAVKPPATITKAETLAKWEQEKRPAAVADAIAKTALNPEDGSIISVCVATDDGEPVVLMRPPEDPSDAGLLKSVFAYLDDMLEDASIDSNTTGERIHRPTPWFIGHNITGFDLPWLWKRAVIHGLEPPFALAAPDELRHGRNCYDTMVGWAGMRGTISLSRLCRVLGLADPKANQAGISGGNAWEFWRRGELDIVDSYNRADVLAVRAVFQRMEAVRGAA